MEYASQNFVVIFSVTGLKDQLLLPKMKVVGQLMLVTRIYLKMSKSFVNVMKNENNYGIQNLIDISRFNDYLKLLRVTAYVVRFVNNLKRKVEKQSLNLQF